MTVTFKNGDKISASKGVLNELSIIYFEASENYKKKGYTGLSSDAEEKSDIIYKELKKAGYYK